ncbi:MAG: 4-(cytidine 5'-diphospho)-2-C-methyl-D-erythritol kinase, partial [Nitrospinota bacterium]
MSGELLLRSPAKVNLGLRVLGLRTDGYHEVDTVLQMVDLWDRLCIRPRRRGLNVRCDHPDVPPGPDNLVYRAAELLRREAGLRGGASICIEKSIPVGAGLGGGSGNAALALWGLNHLWGAGLRREELIALARRLGADVPFFLTAARARGRGRG